MSNGLKFLVLDGYAKEGREDLMSGGASTAGALYQNMLKAICPSAQIDIVYPGDPGASLPQGADIGQYDGVAWTGSSLTIFANDDPKVTRQIEFAKAVFEAGVTSFGSCWAAQIAVAAAGGQCAANPLGREMFIARKIHLTPEGRAHPMYFGKKTVFDGWISHDDEIIHLPHGAQHLAGNDWTNVQAVSVIRGRGEFWALQYHPEYSVHEMARLIYCRKAKLVEKGFFQDMNIAQAMVDDLEALHENPARKDLAWRYGLDEDITNPDIRCMEVRNWIEHSVLRRKSA